MNRVKVALASSALMVIAVAALVGEIRGARVVGQALDHAVPAAASVPALPAAIVVAREPTISEIVDLILRDRSEAIKAAAAGSHPVGSDEGKLAQVLRRHTRDARRADRIAGAIVREGRRRNIGSTLLVGVLLTENPWLDPRATSFMGARGLMQVMPFHSGKWGCKSGDLFDIDANICHGVAILAENLRTSKTLPEALLGYNGCVRGTNTPDCWKYPSKVFRHARSSAADTGPIAGGVVPFSYPESGPRRIAPGAKVVRRGNIMLPRELLVD